MPKETGFNHNLPRLITRQTLDHILLGYVLGYRHISPLSVLQVRAAIEKFIEDFELSEDEFPFDSVISRFYIIYEDLNEFHRATDKNDRMRFRRLQKKNKHG